MGRTIQVGEYVRVSHLYRETKIARIIRILDKDPCYHNMQMYLTDSVVQHDNSCFPSMQIYKKQLISATSNRKISTYYELIY